MMISKDNKPVGIKCDNYLANMWIFGETANHTCAVFVAQVVWHNHMNTALHVAN